MASLKGGKPVKLSIRIWVWFSSLGFAGMMLGLVGFTHLVRHSGQADSSSNAISFVGKRASPSDINCEHVGVHGRYISLANQYHPVTDIDKHHPMCSSRYQQHCLWKSESNTAYLPSQQFLVALRSYEEYHKKCTNGQNLTDHALKGSAPRGCQYLVWRNLDGTGNQLISLVSAFVYSLLTNRVLLITLEAKIQHLFCQPFPRSSWLLPEDFPDNNLINRAYKQGAFYDQALNSSIQGDTINIPTHLRVFLSNSQKPSDLKFFCKGEQKLVEGVSWMFFLSNQYSVPGMYFLPTFRTKLNMWFPDRAVFLHAGRYLLSPQEQIWARIMRIYRSYMDPADRRLAIQVRAWGNNYLRIISDHILVCALHMGVLPNVTNSEGDSSPSVSSASGKNGERISVVLASLRREYAEVLAEEFAEGETVAGERVTVATPSTEGRQQTGQLSHERKAIADMWLLSFADDMISTPKSTFGYVAHGLAGIKPIVFNRYGIDKENVPHPPCWRTNLPGPCFIDHPQNMQCPLDSHESRIGDANAVVPEVRHCDLQWGVGVFEEDRSAAHRSAPSLLPNQ